MSIYDPNEALFEDRGKILNEFFTIKNKMDCTTNVTTLLQNFLKDMPTLTELLILYI